MDKIKWIICVSGLCISCFLSPAYSDDASSRSYVDKISLTIYPLSNIGFSLTQLGDDGSSVPFFLKTLYLSTEIEYSFSKYISFATELKAVKNRYEDQTIFIVGPGFRFYKSGNGMQGLFIGHYVEFWKNTYDKRNDKHGHYSYNGVPHEYISTTWIGYRSYIENIVLEGAFGFYNEISMLRKGEKILTGNSIPMIPIFSLGIGYLF
jgi:hypothetical protein